jgi:hypothetical protein
LSRTGAVVALGLSFGLGTRDIIRNMVAGFYARKFLEVGKNLEMPASGVF